MPKPSKPKGKSKAEPKKVVHLPVIKQVSASNAEAFVMCGASHVLPQSDSHNDYMYRGNEGHEPLAAHINKRTPKTTERGIAMIADFPIERVLDGVALRAAEYAYAVNVKTKTVRFIGAEIGREYGALAKYEVPCTLDAQGVKDGRAWVRDWKFGKSGAWWQLLVQCMAVAYKPTPEDEPDYVEVDAGFIFIDGETGGRIYHEESRLVSLEEIDEACDKLCRAWDVVTAMAERRATLAEVGIPWEPKTVEGDWCTYCGAYDACPAKWAMSRGMLGHMLPTFLDAVPALTPDEKGRVWSYTREAKRMIEAIEEALKGSAMREGCLPLPNGKFLTMVECEGRMSVDKSAAIDTIMRLGGTTDDAKNIMKRGRGYMTSKELLKRSDGR